VTGQNSPILLISFKQLVQNRRTDIDPQGTRMPSPGGPGTAERSHF